MTKQEDCINKLNKIVVSDYKNCPILPSIRIAQVCLESGWLKSELTIKASNCCGIKWDSHKTKKKYWYKNMYWSVFSDISECIQEQGKYYMSKTHYYKDLIGETNLNKAIKALNESPYCEDKGYGNQLLNIINKYDLTKYDNVIGGERMKKIWIDAGHSKISSGASGNGIREEEYVLDVALLLGEKLKRNGFDVGYSREDSNACNNAKNGNQDLNNRCKAANSYNADFFISIHNNSATHTANGIETLVYNQSCTDAIKMAKLMQLQLTKDTKMRDRGIKFRDDLCVLRETKMSAVLVELGFISNVDDANKLKSAGYKDLLATSIAKAVCGYYGVNYKDDSDYNNSVNKLIKNKIITTPSAWKSPNIKYIEDVIFKVCKLKYKVSTYEEAITKLKNDKVIDSPDIWLNKKWNTNHVEQMIIKLSKLL